MSTVPLSELLHLSMAERIQLAEDLWDSVAAEAMTNPENLPLSDAQRDLIRRRSAAYRQNPGAAAPLEEVLDRIERSLG